MIFLYDLGLIVVILILDAMLTEFVAELAGAKPDLILLLVVSLGLFRGKRAGIVSGWVLGLLQDSHSGTLLGLNVLSKGLIGYVTGVLHRHLGDRTTITQLLIVPLATLFDAGIMFGVNSVRAFLFDLPRAPVDETVWITLGTIVLFNTMVSPLVSWTVQTYTSRVKRPR